MTHSALCQAGGLLKNLIDNLDGKNGEDWVEYLRRLMRRQNPFEVPVLSFEKTFTVFKPHPTSRDPWWNKPGVWDGVSLEEKDIDLMNRWPKTMLQAPVGEHLTLVTPRQLGFDGDCTQLPYLWVRAHNVGLRSCSFSAAALTVLEYPKWFAERSPQDIHFASDHQEGRLWSVRSGGPKPSLHSYHHSLERDVGLDEAWVFGMSFP